MTLMNTRVLRIFLQKELPPQSMTLMSILRVQTIHILLLSNSVLFRLSLIISPYSLATVLNKTMSKSLNILLVQSSIILVKLMVLCRFQMKFLHAALILFFHYYPKIKAMLTNEDIISLTCLNESGKETVKHNYCNYYIIQDNL